MSHSNNNGEDDAASPAARARKRKATSSAGPKRLRSEKRAASANKRAATDERSQLLASRVPEEVDMSDAPETNTPGQPVAIDGSNVERIQETASAVESEERTPVVDAVPAAAEAAAPAEAAESQPEEAPPAPEEEIGVAYAGERASPSVETLRTETATAVQELEVEIRNQTAGSAETRNLAADLLRLIRENLERLRPPALDSVVTALRQNVFNSDYLDPDFWRGIAMVLQYQVNELTALIQRRLRGEFAVDAYGMDSELIELVRPVASFLYRSWWRVTSEGLDGVPAEGPALLLANHSGVLPWDSAMIATAVLEDHPSQRLVRSLHDLWMTSVPGLAPALAAFGQAPALPENAARLLSDGQLVCAFPEGVQGAGKLFWNRYRLTGFDAREYIRVALRAGAPIIPVAVIGAEEIYPVLIDVRPLAQLLNLPYFPLTPLFPWFGLLGITPLPSKWSIIFDTPIDPSAYGPAAADDPVTLAQINDLVQRRI
ncbi:MAG: lysophospholipid acyltransferase family protein [Roseiflexaceae bacterium]|nr:lysophospholipid acyltransferase family protein [Roseiflexaceae bacterium]